MLRSRRVSAYSRSGSKRRRLTKSTSSKGRTKYTMAKWKASPNLGLSLPYTSPIARRLRCKLTYFERYALDPGAGGIAADRVFRLNSLFDPDLTGVGHQPAGYDQIMGLYKYYVVVGADAHISFQNTDTVNDTICVASVQNSNATITDVQPIIENGRCNYQWLGVRGSSRDCTDMKLSVNVATEVGCKDVVDNQDLWGQFGSDPTNQLYLHTACQPNSTNNAGIVGGIVVITYDVMFFEPLPVPSS